MSTNKSPTAASKKSILRSTSILSMGTFLSRVLGFVRDMIFASLMGTAAMADAFFVAFRIPNMLRDLVGEGATNSALVPTLSEYVEKKDPKQTNAFLSAVVAWALLILGGLTILGIIFAPLVVKAIAPGFGADEVKLQTTINLTRIMFPYLIFIGLTAYSMGVLYTYGSFLAPAFSSCFLNVVMIATTLIAAQYMDSAVYILAGGVLLGGIAQLVYQWIPLRKLGVRLEIPATLHHDGALKMGKLLVPRVWGSAIYQSNVFVDTFCASLSFIVGTGGISAIYYANRVIQFPLGIFGVALASASLPTLSGYAARKDMEGLRSTVIFALKNILFLLLPSGVLAMVLAVPIVRVVFERGLFDPYSTAITADALKYYGIGLASFGAMKITVSAFHALQDTRTPVKIATVGLALNIALNVFLMYPLKVGGIALASSLSGTASFLMLLYLLHKKVGGIAGDVFQFLWRMIVPLAVLALTAHQAFNTMNIENGWIKIVVVATVAAVGFFGTACVFRVPPAIAIAGWVKAKMIGSGREV